jgi:hypothetical protein
MIAAIDAGVLFGVVWVSIVAGTLVSVAFSLVVLGSARSAEARRSGRTGPASLYAALAVVSLAAFGVIVVLGVRIMLTKS